MTAHVLDMSTATAPATSPNATGFRSPQPNGCRWCGELERGHGIRILPGVGAHSWVAPTQLQIRSRMLARRGHRVTTMRPAPAAELEQALDHLRAARADIARAEQRLITALDVGAGPVAAALTEDAATHLRKATEDCSDARWITALTIREVGTDD